MPDLLLELFSEEIPARMQTRASEDLKKLITGGLVDAGLTYANAECFATPRRLTLVVEGLLAQSPTIREERKGPRVDAPEKAIEGFLRGAGLTRDQLELRDEKKGQIFYAMIEKSGRAAPEIIAEVVTATIRNFPWPKSMRWGTGELRWVRPLHSILCILSDEAGAEVVPFEVDGIATGNTTDGHRFMGTGPFTVSGFDDYAAKLRKSHVILRSGDRADHIWADATNQAFAQGMELVTDPGLLAEVAGLVEWPVVLMGDIGEDFLGLPAEVLQTSMKEHQKFFSVKNPKTGRIEKFVTVANRETKDNGATILAGNQKVLAARLSDAKFFWENDLRVATDKKTGMSKWTTALENVTFHNKLGTQAARITRIAALAREIAPIVGADADLAEVAARIAKADLSSEMVFEFPELQGLMGRYYAAAAGQPDEVAAVCQDHYSPLGPTDTVPNAPLSVAVALSDKLDTLTGFWAINEKPTGSKDPFALRRAALGVIRLLLENDLRCSLSELILLGSGRHFNLSFYRNESIQVYGSGDGWQKVADQILQMNTFESWKVEENQSALAIALEQFFSSASMSLHWNELIEAHANAVDEKIQQSLDLLDFYFDRLKVYLRDQGIRHDVIDACLAMDGNDDLTLLVKRATALADFLKTDDGENLLQGYKRANNILTQAEAKDGVAYEYGPDIKFAEDDAEKALFAALDAADAALKPALASEDFAAAMTAMAALRQPIDAFFEAVQVNADSEIVRRNRLNLLHRIRTICTATADLSKVDG